MEMTMISTLNINDYLQIIWKNLIINTTELIAIHIDIDKKYI